jgi:CspA family cold shock protein
MPKGKVTYFNDVKGWGVISGDATEQDIYVHYTAINMDGFKTLKPGQEVYYEVTNTDRGPHAQNVTLSAQG